MSRWVIVLLAMFALALITIAAYFYGKRASCPPPRWWFKIFRQSGTYRCAGQRVHAGAQYA